MNREENSSVFGSKNGSKVKRCNVNVAYEFSNDFKELIVYVITLVEAERI